MRLVDGFALCLVIAGAFAAAAQTYSPSARLDSTVKQARALYRAGHSKDAESAYESVLPELRKLPPSVALGSALNDLSQIYTDEGSYTEAIQNAGEAAAVYHVLGDAMNEAEAWNNRALAEIQSGGYFAAQSDLQRAFALVREDESSLPVKILNNLGSALFFRGDYSEALRAYDQALELVNAHPHASWADYWRQITQFNQATLYQKLGKYEIALQVYRAVEKAPSLTPDDHAHVLANLGSLYRRLGDPYKALDQYRSAQALYVGRHDSDGQIGVLKNIGIVYGLDLQDLARAEHIFDQALALANTTNNRREAMQAQLYVAEVYLQENRLEESQDAFNHALAAAKELHTTEEQWKALYGLGRIAEQQGDLANAEAEYRDAIAIVETSRSQLQLSALRSDFLADKRDVYDALIAFLFQKQATADVFSFLERSRARNFQDRVAEANAKSSPLTLEEVCSQLDTRTALLETWTAKQQVGAVWCTREKSGLVSHEIAADQMDRLQAMASDVPQALAKRNSEMPSDLAQVFGDFSAFIGPDTRHLIVVPDGWLSALPFELLSAGRNSSRLMIEAVDVWYLPSAVLFRRKTPNQGWIKFPWSRELSAFGDPTFRIVEQTENDVVNQSALQSLPGSAKEVREIAAMANGKKLVFLGTANTRSNFTGGPASESLLLHVSTHAVADIANPENSRMVFSPDNPGQDASYVFLRELYEMNLRNVLMAVISACDTEKGKVVRGEGVQGFSRALLSVGAQSTVTTLWRVDDAATAEFMRQFYYHLLEEHRPRAEALRSAKLTFMHSAQYSDPRYWAAFILSGEGRTPLPRVLSWTALLLLAANGYIALLLLWWFGIHRRRRFNRRHSERRIIAQQS